MSRTPIPIHRWVFTLARPTWRDALYDCRSCGHRGRAWEIHDMFDENGEAYARLICPYCQSDKLLMDARGLYGDGI